MKNVFNFMGVISLALVIFCVLCLVAILICIAANGGELHFVTGEMTKLQSFFAALFTFAMSSFSISLSNRIINREWVLE